jgi:hypothetical protein
MPNAAAVNAPTFDVERVLGNNEKDVQAFDDLVTVVRGKRALALVGAGMSVRAGFPSWNELMTRLGTRLERETEARTRAPDQKPRGGNEEALPPDFRDDFTWQGEVLRTRLEQINSGAYGDELNKTFALNGREPDECSRLLARVPFRHFLTTNYEQVMAVAMKHPERELTVIDWTREEEALKMMHLLLDEHEHPCLVHLHGRVEHLDGIVLTDRDYARHYLRSDSTMRKLFALFALNRFVFFGFSLTDPDLMALLRQVAGGLAYERRPRHFVILAAPPGYPRDDVRERLINKFGVRPIFHENPNKDFAQLTPLVAELARRCALAEDEPLRVARAPGVPVSSGTRDANVATLTNTRAASLSRSARQSRSNPMHPDDPRKGMFGGRDIDGGLRLRADVVTSDEASNWFDITLTVEPVSPSETTLQDTVTFYLHDTFLTPIRPVKVQHGVARLELSAYGAFTVGAVATTPDAELELDLAALPEAPKLFRES